MHDVGMQKWLDELPAEARILVYNETTLDYEVFNKEEEFWGDWLPDDPDAATQLGIWSFRDGAVSSHALTIATANVPGLDILGLSWAYERDAK